MMCILLAKLYQTLPCFIPYSKTKFSCYPRCFLTSYFCIRVPYNEKDIFFGCQFQKVLYIRSLRKSALILQQILTLKGRESFSLIAHFSINHLTPRALAMVYGNKQTQEHILPGVRKLWQVSWVWGAAPAATTFSKDRLRYSVEWHKVVKHCPAPGNSPWGVTGRLRRTVLGLECLL